jgi:hypothetical protein
MKLLRFAATHVCESAFSWQSKIRSRYTNTLDTDTDLKVLLSPHYTRLQTDVFITAASVVTLTNLQTIICIIFSTYLRFKDETYVLYKDQVRTAQ